MRRRASPARRFALAALSGAALLLAACDSSGETQTPIAKGQTALPTGSGFDFYVLALSWSPSYCEAEGEDANRQQCKADRPYAFIVHGLWPQFEHGYPQDCPVVETEVPRQALRTLYDIMPSAGLIRHQWRKHGSCSGLSQTDYFAVLRKARQAVTVPGEFAGLNDYRTVAPDNVERSFLQSNAGLPGDGIAVTCDKHYLREIRICLSKDLEFRSCPEVDSRSCRLSTTVMPPVRGG
ncbi:ribonuclease T2 family protein [Arvimicrobium flavum]|uniref:ribonuclease T2 family protein n=1 Tax=Arvimicrobium flavum TaxID=3393320 RepID=UPI00237BEC5B|nr:ribonuclease [Mesorhizobium shangrilense]